MDPNRVIWADLSSTAHVGSGEDPPYPLPYPCWEGRMTDHKGMMVHPYHLRHRCGQGSTSSVIHLVEFFPPASARPMGRAGLARRVAAIWK
ncbi:hypothetical protein CDAR_381621 [Caerostris darwini]|uniref:Uncharacterized protein n=1 Tax=Caerostris darwini TaxID=1538125 RepID=A0AAV4V664_9ARAC|nr:hypothetical protein CDAR_381621 [Caerostris darwini]